MLSPNLCLFETISLIIQCPSHFYVLCFFFVNVFNSCVGNLVCFQRNGGTPVPGCTGSSSSKTDFCINPDDDNDDDDHDDDNPTPNPVPAPTPTAPTPTAPTSPTDDNLVPVHFIDSDPNPSHLPLDECEGDCDNDDEVRVTCCCRIATNYPRENISHRN